MPSSQHKKEQNKCDFKAISTYVAQSPEGSREAVKIQVSNVSPLPETPTKRRTGRSSSWGQALSEVWLVWGTCMEAGRKGALLEERSAKLINHFGEIWSTDDKRMTGRWTEMLAFSKEVTGWEKKKADLSDLQMSGVRFVFVRMNFPSRSQGHLAPTNK